MRHRLLLALPLLATATVQAPRQPPVLTAFAINDGAGLTARDTVLVLTHDVAGTTPTEYRVSARADFAGAPWHAYQRRPVTRTQDWPFQPGCDAPRSTHRVRLFLQVRSRAGDDVRITNGKRALVPVWLESNVLADSICVGRTG